MYFGRGYSGQFRTNTQHMLDKATKWHWRYLAENVRTNLTNRQQRSALEDPVGLPGSGSSHVVNVKEFLVAESEAESVSCFLLFRLLLYY